MMFLSKGEFFKGYDRALVFVVYADKVTALVMRHTGGKIEVEASVTEPEEGNGDQGASARERIVLNCEKALAMLPEKTRDGIKNAVVFLGGGVGAFFFVRAEGIRQPKARKIAPEEISALATKWYGKETKTTPVFRNIPERFWVDGFSIPDPVGMNGKEIMADMVSLACDPMLAGELETFVSAQGMQLAGLGDVREALAAWEPINGAGESATIVAIFEQETSILFVKERKIMGIRTARAGYGILSEKLVEVYGVGRQEARRLIDGFRREALEQTPMEEVKKIAGESSSLLAETIKQAVAGSDPGYLLPGTVRIATSDRIPLMYDGLLDSQWLSGLPFEKSVRISMAEDDVFESAIVSYLII